MNLERKKSLYTSKSRRVWTQFSTGIFSETCTTRSPLSALLRVAMTASRMRRPAWAIAVGHITINFDAYLPSLNLVVLPHQRALTDWEIISPHPYPTAQTTGPARLFYYQHGGGWLGAVFKCTVPPLLATTGSGYAKSICTDTLAGGGRETCILYAEIVWRIAGIKKILFLDGRADLLLHNFTHHMWQIFWRISCSAKNKK